MNVYEIICSINANTTILLVANSDDDACDKFFSLELYEIFKYHELINCIQIDCISLA